MSAGRSRMPAPRAASRVARAALLAVLALAALAPAPPPPAPAPVAAGPDLAIVRTLEGRPYLGAADLARLLGATRFWRADIRKLVLRAAEHRVVFTVDNPFLLVDARTIYLGAPVRAQGGELWVPAEVLSALPDDATLPRLVMEPGGTRVRVVPPEGLLRAPRVVVAGDLTRVTIDCERAPIVQIIGRSRARFRVHLAGACLEPLPDSLPSEALVRRVSPLGSGPGVTFEFALAREARGFRIAADTSTRRVTLEFARTPLAGLQAFAPEGPLGPRSVRVVVLDPAHGGADAGVQAGGLLEKDVTLALARALAPELERRLGARVVLTRTDDRALTVEARAEAANRAHADLVLVLHVDGAPTPAARGATAYCASATESRGEEGGTATIAVMPWRDVALRHAVASRALADAVLDALQAHGEGPVRVREMLPLHLLGVNAPGIALECATLTSPVDRGRLAAPLGIAALATAIADGVAVWQRND